MEQKTAKKKADTLFSKQIRALGHCQNCGKTEGQVQLQCAHWISRRYSNTRVVAANAFCLCAGCHFFYTHNPTEFSRWAIDQRGEDVYQGLRELSQSISKVDWNATLKQLRER